MHSGVSGGREKTSQLGASAKEPLSGDMKNDPCLFKIQNSRISQTLIHEVPL